MTEMKDSGPLRHRFDARADFVEELHRPCRVHEGNFLFIGVAEGGLAAVMAAEVMQRFEAVAEIRGNAGMLPGTVEKKLKLVGLAEHDRVLDLARERGADLEGFVVDHRVTVIPAKAGIQRDPPTPRGFGGLRDKTLRSSLAKQGR